MFFFFNLLLVKMNEEKWRTQNEKEREDNICIDDIFYI